MARAAGIPLTGLCTFHQRDELGRLPQEIAEDLMRCSRPGTRSALSATLERANLLVVVLPDARRPTAAAGIGPLLTQARAQAIPHILIDPMTDLEALAVRLRTIEAIPDSHLRVMVTGPRQTRWPLGERLAASFVSRFAVQPELPVSPAMHRILVVDDDRATLEVTSDLLRTWGHEVAVAETGPQGLSIAGELRPDVGLFDLHLPGMSGYELAQRFRASRERKNPLYLAAITGWDLGLDPAKALSAGFDRHVRKPTNTASLRDVLAAANIRLALAC